MPGKTFTQEDYIAQRKKRRADAESRAADTLKDHKYTALAEVESPVVQVWRCAQPGSSCYGFDISITRFGIAVMGDIDSLVFRVGSSYGLEFLAGDDIDYYIHSKLEEQFKERELDVASFRSMIMTNVCELLVTEASDEEAYDALPEWVREEQARGPDGSLWETFVELIRAKNDAYEYTGEDDQIDWVDIDTLIREADGVTDLNEGLDFCRTNHELLNLGDDWWDYDFSMPADRLIERLHMVRHAAKQILALKAKEAAA